MNGTLNGSEILNGSEFLQRLEMSGNLAIWPDTDFSDPVFLDRPLVILLHGLGRTMIDMTNPTSQEFLLPYDPEWTPDRIDDGWQRLPPTPIQDIMGLITQFLADPSVSSALQAILGADLEVSPRVHGDLSWFSFFRNHYFPVLAYSMNRAGEPMNAPENEQRGLASYPEFQRLMLEVDQSVLNDQNGGLAGCKKIALVGHSRGGLMARRYVVEALSGILGPEHEDLVTRRVRFLGTLNSPHYGAFLAATPDWVETLASTVVLLPFVSDFIGTQVRGLVDEFVVSNIADPESVDELTPYSPLIQNLLDQDLNLLAADPRMGRIRRASTGSIAPVIRRMFVYAFDPESFIPLPRWWDPSHPFHHTRSPHEVPLSPLLEDIGLDPSVWEYAELRGFFTVPPNAHEFRALGPDMITQNQYLGGDVLVTDASAHIPGVALGLGDHRTFRHHHGAPLWHRAYKPFMESQIPRGYCYPSLEFLLGDNLVEISWPALPDPYNPYMVCRFRGGPVERRGETSVSLFYDPVDTTDPLRYQVLYPNPITGGWIPHDESQADFAGSLPVTIKNCWRNDQLPPELISLQANVAASPAGDNFVVFSVTERDLLTDSIAHSLAPNRSRIIARTSQLDRISEPFSLATTRVNCDAAWIEYGPLLTDTEVEPPFPQLPEESREGLVVPSQLIGSQQRLLSYSRLAGLVKGLASLPDPSKTPVPGVFVWRVMAGRFDERGFPQLIREIARGQNPSDQQHWGGLGGPPIPPPRFVPIEKDQKKGYLFAWTTDPYHLQIVETDDRFEPASEPIKIEIQPTPPQIPIPVSFDQAEANSLVLHDLFADLSSPGRYMALVELTQTRDLFVVNFTSQGQGVISKLEMPWHPSGPAGFKGAIIEGPPHLLHLFISYRPLQPSPRMPRYATVPVQVDYSLDTNNLEWHHFALQDLPEAADFRTQDILRRCGSEVEVLISATGFFQNRDISSSLYRIGVASTGITRQEMLHHSGYGPYLVTFTRAAFPTNSNAVFWLTPPDAPFEDGLYGEPLLREIADCQTSFLEARDDYANVFLGTLQLAEILQGLCSIKGSEDWVIEFCRTFKSPELFYDLVMHPRLRTPMLILLSELHNLLRWIEVQEEFPKGVRDIKTHWHRVRQRVILVMETLYAVDDPRILEEFANLGRALEWESSRDRAKELVKHMAEQGRSSKVQQKRHQP